MNARSLVKTAQYNFLRRTFHSSPKLNGGGGHHDPNEIKIGNLHYSPGPTTDENGRLFGIPKGQKLKMTHIEAVSTIAVGLTIGLTLIGLYYKPDYSLQTWGYQEYCRRVKARGGKTPIENMQDMKNDDLSIKYD
ncbi:valS [Acrasis kona]|uniref:NADH dehydrogenase [ubiquinone] 1 beta subcomplex subunit 11, mitochondrial n=1 Tax=Acrasis kona TaxID=1008807 RepID=A0AAW2ZAI6_9EUKA